MIAKSCFLICFFCLGSSLGNAAETLESIKIKDVADLSRCYQIAPYQLNMKNGPMVTKQWIDQDVIVQSCSQEGFRLAQSKTGNPKILIQIAEELRRNHREEASLPVFRVLAESDKSLQACDNAQLYSALLAGLKHPRFYPNPQISDVDQAYGVMDVCMKKTSFAQDIQEEIDKNETFAKDNLCTYMKLKNFKSKCQGS